MKSNTIPLILSLAMLAILGGCASQKNIALEKYNRGMYAVNKTVDRYTLKPIAKGYRAITPDPVERSVSHFFDNIGELGTMTNSLLQGKFHNLAASSARFVWNSTLGLAGLFDVATAMDIKANDEDFGQTLRYWGVPSGPYIVLPLLGPSTVTDSVGLVGDAYISPLFHVNNNSIKAANKALVAVAAVDRRAQLLEKEKLLQNATTDEYGFVKSAYLQRRQALVNDGKQDTSLDEDFDALFEE